MNKLALVGVPLGILAAAAAAVPYYVGMQTEHAMRAEATRLAATAQFPLNVTFMRYERGWLSSSAVSRFTLKAEPGFYLDVRHDISHRPDPQTGWVHVRSVPEWTGPLKAALDYYFGGQPPLTVDTIIGFDGGRQTAFSSPAFTKPVHDLPAAKLSWGGMQGTVSMGADRQLVAVATVPHLLLEGGDNEGGFKALKVDAKWDLRGTAADWQGETKVALTEFRFSGLHEQVAVKDVSGEAYQRSKGDNVLFGYVLRVGAGSSAKAGETEQSFTNAVLDLEFDQINRKALAKYLDDLGNAESLTAASDTQGQHSAQVMMELAGELLRGSPVIRLKRLGVETPSGAVSAQATLSFDGSNLAELQFSPELLTRLKAKGNVEIAGSLLRSQLQRKVRPQVEVALGQQGAAPSEANIKALSEKLSEDQLKSLTDTGLLRQAGSNFTVEAELASGQVMVNGQPANELFGGMMGAPVPVEQPKQPVPPKQAANAEPQVPVKLVQRAAPGQLAPKVR